MDEMEIVNVTTQRATQGFVLDNWEVLLEIARAYGWVPLGTLPASDAPDDQCNGAYTPGLGQRMTAEDAKAFAAALSRVIEDIPESDDIRIASHIAGSERMLRAMESYRGQNRRVLQRLIEGCEVGEVRIFPPGPS